MVVLLWFPVFWGLRHFVDELCSLLHGLRIRISGFRDSGRD